MPKFQISRELTVKEFYEFKAKNKAEAKKIADGINDGSIDEPDDFELVHIRDIYDTPFVLQE